METKPFCETLSFQLFRIPDDGQHKTSDLECSTLSPEPFTLQINLVLNRFADIKCYFKYCGVNKKLTPWSLVLLEKMIVAPLLNTLRAFYGIRKFIVTFTRAHQLVAILNGMNLLHIVPTYFYMVCFNILSTPLRFS
jgi:hypothetical protein